MHKISAAVRRFNTASRHWEARHPIWWAVAYVSFLEAIWIPFGALTVTPVAAAAIYFAVLVTLMASLQKYLWRPGGMKRRHYESWCERQRDPEQWRNEPFRSGWYLDATHRHRLRYWDGSNWTAWVADFGDAFVDDGRPISGSTELARRMSRFTSPALPLLVGLTIGAIVGAALIVAAFAFPHPIDVPFGSIGSSERLGGIWLLTAAAIATGAATSIVFAWRTPVRVSAPDPATPPPSAGSSARATFGRALGAAVGVGALAAWPTWIQGWPAMIGLALLAGLVGIAIVAAIFAAKVSRIERTERGALRAGGLLQTLKGAFVASPTT